MDRRTLGDDELALALKSGDDKAFEELVRRHQGRVYAIAYRLTANREDALDVAQDALIRAYRRIDTWQPKPPSGGQPSDGARSSFLPWLMRLTTNRAIDVLRKRQRQPQRLRPAGTERDPMEDIPLKRPHDTESRVQAGETRDRIEQALEVLSPSQRTVFVMRHYEGLPLADIAEAMGCTLGSVKVHLFRAMKKLQAELAEYYAQNS